MNQKSFSEGKLQSLIPQTYATWKNSETEYVFIVKAMETQVLRYQC